MADTLVTAEDTALLVLLRSELVEQCKGVRRRRMLMGVRNVKSLMNDEEYDAEVHRDLLRDEYAKRNDIESEHWVSDRIRRVTNAIATIYLFDMDSDKTTLKALMAYKDRIVEIGALDPGERMAALTPAERSQEDFLSALRDDPKAELDQLSDNFGVLIAARIFECDGLSLAEPDRREVQKLHARWCTSWKKSVVNQKQEVEAES